MVSNKSHQRTRFSETSCHIVRSRKPTIIEMDSQKARAEFLRASSRMLFSSSPSTSRHLQSQSTELPQSLRPSKTPAQQRDACTACGNLFIPGWTTETKIFTRGARRRQRSTSQKTLVRSTLVSNLCLVCHRTTREVAVFKTDIRKSQSKPRKAPAIASTASIEKTLPLPDESMVEQPVKTNSKKRAKARKDRDGLQALLSKSAKNKPAPSLSFMDLMKR